MVTAMEIKNEYLDEFGLDRKNANVTPLITADTPRWDIREHREGVRDWLQAGLVSLVGAEAQWLPEYEQVVDWLCYNDGKGLLLHGDCGRGKSLLTTQLIPIFIHKQYRKRCVITDARHLKEHFADGKQKFLYQVIDDVGTETVLNDYGTKRDLFPELVDYADKHGLILIVSSNLSRDELERYGERTFDRIRSGLKRIELRGKSLRATAR